MNHPITPPPELVQQWHADWYQLNGKYIGINEYLATQAARWGANQELEACVEWMRGSLTPFMPDQAADQLRAARRPKPPGLKERALQAWAAVEANTDDQTAMVVIRRALEQLDD